MRPIDNSLLTPEERLSEVATILATGVQRLSIRVIASNPALADTPDAPEKLISPDLEVSDETVLSVHNG